MDPSCGEGDMLLGMLRELERLGDEPGAGEASPHRRRRIVERNLYGVEVQPAAFESASRRLAAAALTGQPDSGGAKGARLNLACGDSLVERSPFSWKDRFPEVWAEGGFDLVVGNPPYVRHERIEDPLGQLTRSLYKGQAMTAAHARLASLVHGEMETVSPLDGRSDLSALFLLAGLSLLKPGGVLAFVLPTSLFEARYGRALQGFLGRVARKVQVVECRRQRSFLDAGVNTAILVVSLPRRSDRAGCVIRREEVDRWFEAAQLADRPGPLRSWGGREDIGDRLADRLEGRLATLGSLGELRYPVKTGNNRFFYPDEGTLARYGVEPEFCTPILRSPRAVRHIAVGAEELPAILFSCDRSLEELEASGKLGALGYILWGSRQRLPDGTPWHQAPSLRGRRYWYEVPRPAPADIICPRFYDRRFFFVAPLGPVLEDQTFYGLRLRRPAHRDLIAAVLNSSLTYLLVETSGRTGLGYGARQYALCDMRSLPAPNVDLIPPDLRPEILRAFSALSQRTILPVGQEMEQTDRWTLDAAVGAALGLSEGEMREVRRALVEHTQRRLERALR